MLLHNIDLRMSDINTKSAYSLILVIRPKLVFRRQVYSDVVTKL